MREPALTSCAELARDFDWTTTDLGARESWPHEVETLVGLLLESPVAMAYCHGERLALVYNDGIAVILGDKHPQAWGQPMRAVVPEVWDDPRIGAAMEHVLRTGKPFFEDGTPVAMERRSGPEPAEDLYFVRGYSPVRAAHGRILGVLAVVVETTEGVGRVRTVAELASSFASAASVDDVVKVALRHAVEALGVEEVTVCLPERRSGGWRTTTRRRTDALSEDEERLPLIWSTASARAGSVVARVAESGTPSVPAERGVVLPLSAGGVSGAVAFALPGTGAMGLQATVLATCTDLLAQALGRARLYDSERRTADLLQRTLLPQLLPHRPGMSLAVRYQPVTTGTAAGGDFYDVFEVPDGRLAVVIGDVVGRGVAAATVMGQVRAAVRGAALAQPQPDRVFASLDGMVPTLDEVSSLRLGSHPLRADDPWSLGSDGELFVTMLYCLLDPATGTLTMASAGHFPPVLMRHAPGVEGGTAVRVVRFADLDSGPPLGVPGHRPTVVAELAEGDALLAFTDGLLERRDRDLAEGESLLLEALSGVESHDPRSLCQHAIDAMVGEHHLEDDCALLALVRTSAVHYTASVVTPPLASAVRRTRSWVEQRLQEWGVGEEASWAAVMGVSELVTNVLLHAATEARVTLDLSAERLLVTVADTGTRGAPRLMHGEVTATRGRGLALVAELASSSGFEHNVAGSTSWFEVPVG